jgi:hypothetical protein
MPAEPRRDRIYLEPSSAPAMLTRLIPLALAINLFACPLICRAAHSFGAPQSTAESCGCCHHSKDSAPTGQSGGRKAGCQCICGGAVMDHGTLPTYAIDADHWALLPAMTVGEMSAPECLQSSAHPTFLIDDGMNVGRAMRCLYMTFLC